MQHRINVKTTEVLSKGWGVLTKTTFDYQRSDGSWDRQTRETYDHGHAAAVLPYDHERRTVLLVRQFRYPPFAEGHPEPLLEVCAGLLDADDPQTCARREAEEELGYKLHNLDLLFTPFMSPGSLTERIACFVAAYSPSDRVSQGGGEKSEGEDIEVVEMQLAEAAAAIIDGGIVDAKTIMLLHALMLKQLSPEKA